MHYRPKPLHYREQSNGFKEYAEKIIYIVVDDMPDSEDAVRYQLYIQACIYVHRKYESWKDNLHCSG